ncbi:MAG: ABC transporter ATP-binding protein [Caldilineaceae bacterium]
MASEPPKQTSNDRQILLRCFSYLKPYWPQAAGAYLALLCTIGIALVTPQFIRWIIDSGINNHDPRLLVLSVLGLLAITFVRGVFTFVQGRLSEVASQGVAYDIRNAIHTRLTELSFGYHDRTETGQLLSRSVQDVERIRFLTGRATLGVAGAIVLIISTAIALFFMNPTLAVLSMATVPFLAWRGFAFGRDIRPLSLYIQQQLAVLTTQIEQNLRGARIVKSFAQEDAEIEAFDQENRRWFDLSARAARIRSVNIPLMDFIANVGTVAVIWYGGSLVINGQMTIGELVAFTTYLAQLAPQVRRMGMIIPIFAIALASGERIFEILDTPVDVQDEPGATELPPIAGSVRFENVSFGYLAKHRVLRDVSIDAKPGQVIALLGATGSGKSSIINLIPRFYDPDIGTVCVDGVDLREVTLHSLRSQIGMVLQDTTLFAATIAENIAFGRPDASRAEIAAAAQSAQAHEFIVEMEHGYDTEIGERGVTLSGGQKQRIAIARALLTDPRILILDDATSSVDTETERLIQLALENLMRGRTSFVIAQRLSTVRMADQILVLEKGRVTASGTHRELLDASPLYAKIYHGQLEMFA